jgi:uncharacterized protein (DUF1499 family)
MRYLLRHLLVVAAVVGAFWLVSAWPRINEVETGQTPEYADLTVRDYGASPEAVVEGVKTVISRLPRWELVGSGKGPGGAEIQAVHTTQVLRLEDDVTIRVRRDKGRTVVSVRSKSRFGKWDFGQNARNIRELLEALDHQVF